MWRSSACKGVARYPLVLMLEPLFRCNLACAGCGKIDYPDAILNQRLSVADCLEAVDECGAPVVSIAGGEPLLHREIEEIVRRHHRAQEIRLSLHQRAADGKEARPLQAQSLSSSGRSISTATARCTTTRCARTASTTAPSRRSGWPRRAASASTSTARCSTAPSPSGSPQFFDEVMALGDRRHHRLARLCLRARARPGAFPQPAQDQGAVPRHLPPGTRAQMVVQPVRPVPRFPRRQPDLSLHALGQSDAQLFRLAAALLSARRGLCQDASRS